MGSVCFALRCLCRAAPHAHGGDRRPHPQACQTSIAPHADRYAFGLQDFHQRTLSGGIITIVASVVMALLFLSELRELPPAWAPPHPWASPVWWRLRPKELLGACIAISICVQRACVVG